MENRTYLNSKGQGVVESAVVIALFTSLLALGLTYFKNSKVEIKRSQWNSFEQSIED